jgi:hypothetical protein
VIREAYRSILEGPRLQKESSSEWMIGKHDGTPFGTLSGTLRRIHLSAPHTPSRRTRYAMPLFIRYPVLVTL